MSNQEFDLTGKVAIITGGSGALGGSMAIHLIKQGVKVAILDLRPDATEKRVEELKALGGEAMALVSSVLDKEQLEAAKDKIVKEWGTIDILINAAGGNMPGATIAPDQTIFDLSIEDFKKVSDLNLNGTVLPSIVFGKVMAENNAGVMINISSMTAQRAITRVVGYSAAKAAIDNFTRWMSVEMALKFGGGVRVNAIAPGFFIGEQNRKLLTNEDGSLTDRGKTIIAQTPMGRFGEAEELNGTIHWLCSEASKFVTGIVVPIDGGFSAYSGV
ncbi:SDR family oxidoreductase [Flexithrix dorotheae]|uniref:SDR family oxidoreductase n=1 Tax=Flexithrix dorotheae TaxID=70993 RepID=UPI0012F86003